MAQPELRRGDIRARSNAKIAGLTAEHIVFGVDPWLTNGGGGEPTQSTVHRGIRTCPRCTALLRRYAVLKRVLDANSDGDLTVGR